MLGNEALPALLQQRKQQMLWFDMRIVTAHSNALGIR